MEPSEWMYIHGGRNFFFQSILLRTFDWHEGMQCGSLHDGLPSGPHDFCLFALQCWCGLANTEASWRQVFQAFAPYSCSLGKAQNCTNKRIHVEGNISNSQITRKKKKDHWWYWTGRMCFGFTFVIAVWSGVTDQGHNRGVGHVSVLHRYPVTPTQDPECTRS